MRQVIRAALGLALVLVALFAVAPPSEQRAASQTIETDPCSGAVSTVTPTPAATTAATTETPLATIVAAIDVGSGLSPDIVVVESPSPSPALPRETATTDPASPTTTPDPTPTPTPNPLPVSSDSGVIDPAVGGTIQLADGSVKVHFEPGDVAERVSVAIREHIGCERHDSSLSIISEIELTAVAVDRGDAEVTSFDRSVDLEINHTLEELIAYNPETLTLRRLNEENGAWEQVPAEIDGSAGTVHASLDHFTVYSTQGETDIVLPAELQAFQVDMHTLSASASIPLDLPPGPGGLGPELSLNYSTSTVNEMKSRTTTGSWAGVGWNLSVPSVIKDPFPTSLHGRYFLSMNGVSDLLIRENSPQSGTTDLFRFYTKRDSHLSILGRKCQPPGQSSPSETVDTWYEFTIRTKDGTRYEFGNTPDGPACYYADPGQGSPRSLQWFSRYWANPAGWHRYYYRMDISRITDVRGNFVNFDYWQNIRTDCGGQPGCPSSRLYIRAAYPSIVEWGGNTTAQSGHLYRILFNQNSFDDNNAAIAGWDVDYPSGVGRVRADSPIDDPGSCQPHVMEVRSLTSVRVIHIGSGEIIREYVPGYDKSDTWDSRGAGSCTVEAHLPISGNLKLATWTEKGRGAASTLRTMNFTYTSGAVRYRNGGADCESPNTGAKSRPFIFKATNGFGGETRHSYDAKWVAVPGGAGCGWDRWILRWRTPDPDGDGGIDHPHEYLPWGPAVDPVYVSITGDLPRDAEFRGFPWVKDRDAISNDFSECLYDLSDFLAGQPTSCSWYESCTPPNCTAVQWRSYSYDVTDTCVAACNGWETTAGAEYYEQSKFGKLQRLTEHVSGRADVWTDYAYDGWGNITRTCEYAAAPPGTICGGAPYRRTTTAYNVNSDLHVYIVSTPKTVWVQSPSETLSETNFFYDLQGHSTPPIYGILTKTDQLADAGWININQIRHDVYGNVTQEWEYFNNDSGNFGDCEAANCRLTTTDASACSNTQPASVTNALAQSTTFGYDCVLGAPLSVKDANGVATETRYDTFGRPTKSWTYPDTESSWTTEFAYFWDATAPSMTSVGRREGLAGGMLWEATCVDGLGRQTQLHRESATPGKIIVSDTAYDGTGNKAWDSIPYERDSVSAGVCPGPMVVGRTTYTYDAIGRVTNTTHPAPIGNVVTTSYGAGGADADEVRTVHDLGGGLKNASDARIDALGRTIRVQELNSDLSVYATTSYLYDQADRLYSVTDNAGNPTSITYDKAGWKKQLVDPDTGTWGYSQFNDRLLKTQTDPRTEITTLAYDLLGRVATKSYSGPITAAPISYNYDFSLFYVNGELVRGTDAAVYVIESGTKRHVTANGMVACGYSPDLVVRIDDTVLGSITQGAGVNGAPCPTTLTYRYDSPVGRQTKVDDDPGETLVRYDERGRTVFHRDVREGTNYDISRTYDSMDREATLTYPDGEVLTTTYNVQGTPSGLTSNVHNSLVTGAAYNAADSPTSISLGNTRALTFGYRPEDLRLTSVGVSGGLLSNTYTYDKAFNVTSVTDSPGVGTVNYTYDHLNRLTGTSGPYTSEYAYDAIGNIKKKRENETQSGTREWGTNGTQCADETDTDSDGRINDGCTATFPELCYKPGDHPVDPPGCTTGRPHALKSANGDNPAFKPLSGLEAYVGTAYRSTYSYDTAGNLLETQGKNHVTDPANEGSLGLLMKAEYDAEGRLARIPYNKLDTPAGGMGFFDADNSCTYTSQDQSLMSPTFNRSIPDPLYDNLFDHNSDGRVSLADITLVGGTYDKRCPTFIYDHSGQLARIEGRLTLSGTAYGPYDRLYIGGVYEKKLDTGEVTKYYSLGGRRVALSKGGTLSYLASDHLGGTSLVMQGAAPGNATSRMRYHPYGQVWTQSAAPATDKLFTGHTRLGARSGMYYAGARFYSADLGRFMSADSIVPGAGDPQALNRYAYVRGNPLRFSDPTGHRLMDDAGHSGTCRLSCYDDAVLRNCEFPRCRPESGRGAMARTCQTDGWGAATLCTSWRRAAPMSLVEDLVYGAAADFGGGPFDDVYLGARESWRCTFGAGCNPLMLAAVVPMCPKACGTLASKALRFSDEAGDAGRFAGKAGLARHFRKHGAGVGATTAQEYETQASRFLTGDAGAGVLQKTRTTNGDVIRLNPTTQEFGVLTTNGTVRTYFKADPAIHGYDTNLDYFNAQ